MEFTYQSEESIDVFYLKAEAKVRYFEDGILNGTEDEHGEMPCVVNETWCPVIEVLTGKIINWKEGNSAQLHYKVCDCGTYTLLGSDKESLKVFSGYVPDIMCIGENGYGDYLIMEINEQGFIKDWKPSLDCFEDYENFED